MIYIASPYSHPSSQVRYMRFLDAREYAVKLMRNNLVCFSPIVYGHQFAVSFDFDHVHEAWLDFNQKMLYAASHVHVLQLDGWEQSKGVQAEIAFAKLHGIPFLLVPGNIING